MDACLTGLVLAGGAARRLGGRKTDRLVGGRALVRHAVDLARACCDEVVLLADNVEPPAGVLEPAAGRPAPRRVADWPGARGPVAALGAGLEAARHPWSLVLACDMPFYDRAAVEDLLAACRRAGGARVVAWSGPRGPEPFGALWHREALDVLRPACAAGGGALRDVLACLPVELVEPSDPARREALTNVNTPDDLARARARPPAGPGRAR